MVLSGACLLLSFSAGTAFAALPASTDPSQQLDHADSIKTSNHPTFVQLLAQLDRDAATLTTTQQWHLRYLDAWEVAYEGKYDAAGPLLSAIIEQSPDDTLRFRATATRINILGIAHRYEDAFSQLSQLIDQLPRIRDDEARYQALVEASQFLTTAGQYDLAISYAQQMLDDTRLQRHQCIGTYLKLHAQFRKSGANVEPPPFQDGIDICVKAGENLIANAGRADIADLAIQQGRYGDAIALLQRNYADVRSYRYPAQIAIFDTLLAKAYLRAGDAAQARKFALATIDDAVKSEYAESLSQAYEVLYLVESQQGNVRAALGYHEKFMEADKGYLNDIRARALAYQTVKQQLLANKLQVETLNKQNSILQLQRELDRKAVENGRLYIALLLMFLASVGLWLFRLKRSQLRFMRLAQQDSLTGIYSRQHFVDAAELALRQAAKSTRSACLILMDLDHFKLVNDTYGHGVGDMVLKRTVAACQAHLLRRDVFGRLGGEEFAIFLPECGPAQAREKAELIRLAIAATPVNGETRDVAISASFGVASTDRSGYELRQLMIDADNALYRAKRDGRNRVVYGEIGDVSVEPKADTDRHVVNNDLGNLPPHTGIVS
ncbi:tetratricopeptide repeat-containing diguanylate cyclase [Dyella humicola]|uniref:tetratricopeptide repeat-containing diguanylate cyclase n=1 Tax=Dyella humicola TaxID=2992126 RepID=UPI002259720A|nr:GGDEF domain-containing protein [Dyella humicola]